MDQLYMKYHSFNPLADPTYKPAFKQKTSDWLIMWRSCFTHTEIQFPEETHGGISFSSTMADGHGGARFKDINFKKHPLRWETILIPVTREQVRLIFNEACRMADILYERYIDFHFDLRDGHLKPNHCYYGPNALKYDLLGLASFTTRWNWIHPHDKWVWCTEACFVALMAAFPYIVWESAANGATYYGATADKLHPEAGHKVIKAIYGKAA